MNGNTDPDTTWLTTFAQHMAREDPAGLEQTQTWHNGPTYQNPHIAETTLADEPVVIALHPHGELDHQLRLSHLPDHIHPHIKQALHQAAREAGLDPSTMDPIPYHQETLPGEVTQGDD